MTASARSSAAIGAAIGAGPVRRAAIVVRVCVLFLVVAAAPMASRRCDAADPVDLATVLAG